MEQRTKKRTRSELDEWIRLKTWDAGLWETCREQGWEREKVLEICKHMIGIPKKKPYIRHGAIFYKPWRNFFAGENPALDVMAKAGIVTRMNDLGEWYYTFLPEGLEWLGRQLGVTIHQEDD